MPDISRYAARIQDDVDRPLFPRCREGRRSRGSAWRVRHALDLFAESIKRRFREGRKARRGRREIVGEFGEQKEKDHRSVDKFVLDKAKEYGFITDTAYAILLNVYEMRCVYGHPYEQAPMPEQVSHAAAMVVEHILSLSPSAFDMVMPRLC